MSLTLLLPIRIPELGPSLGKLVTGTGDDEDGAPLGSFRTQLVTKIIGRAGEARRLAAHDERAAALAALGRDAWLAVWEETVAAVADRLADRVTEHLEAEARAVGMPGRLRRLIAVDGAERRALTARLGSAGAGLIPCLDRIDRSGRAVLTATALERDAVDEWSQAQLAAARGLEAAWLELRDAVTEENAHWRRVADRVSCWRKPWWPVLAFGLVSTAAAGWIGALVGGFLPVPDWLRVVLDAVVVW